MDRTIRHITEQFVSKLPEGKDHYRIEDLKEYGFPAFLIQRIHIELQWNLDESMILPKTDWADTRSETVQQSWQQFLNVIQTEVHLPESYARAVIETAVADIMEMLVQPRKNIIDILFGGEDELLAEEVEERTELLVVYPHFARVITRYMNRKNKQQLDREQCKGIIRKVDEKVTRQYTPLQWAQMLDPLFALAGPDIDTNLLRLFFEDRNMNRAARKFDMMNGEINRASFIEILSSPELLNYDDYEEDRSELFNEEQPERPQKGVDQPLKKEEVDVEASDEEEEMKKGEAYRTSEIEDEEDISDADEAEAEEEQELLQSMHAEQGKQNESEPLVEQHLSGEKPGDEDEEQLKETETSSLNAFFSQRTSTDETHDDEEEPTATDEKAELETLREQADDDEDGEKKSAIWMRFMQSEEIQKTQQYEADEEFEDEQEPDQPEDEYLDEPIIDLTENDEQQAEELKQLLRDDKSYFVEELFNGSERAYEESLQEIAEKDTWEKASKLIEKNIFKRNMIDIYSEAAVDFTDRLQTYFLDKQNRN